MDVKVDEARATVAKFIGSEKNEVVFTEGTTGSLNLVAYGYGLKFLKKDDEIIISEAEHSSNILPWFRIAKLTGAVVKYIPLTSDGKITADNLMKVISKKTKIVSIAQVGNVLGYTTDVKELAKVAHQFGAIMVVDGAQSVPHMCVNFKDLDIDFLAFSAHKMLGPMGVGVLYGKYDLLNEVIPVRYGGGMNVSFLNKDRIEYKNLPYRLEAGTQNISGVLGLGTAIDYINNIGIDNIEEICDSLKEYIVSELKKIPHITLYNENVKGSTIAFNVKGVFAQDTALYLDKYNICVRSGSHCAKKLEDELEIKNTCRVSIYFYNTKEDADKLINALKNKNILEESIGV